MILDYDAVIFDCDGTLLDSMGLWKDVDVDFLADRGIEFPEGLQEDINGRSAHETAVYFKDRFGFEDSVEELLDIWNNMALDSYMNKVKMKEGAYELLEFLLDNNMKMGIATSNSRELIDASVEVHNLDKYMTSIVTSHDIKRGKPAPDVYLEVAKQLDVEPSRCLVFEDIVPGIMAGKAAGMTVCAIYDKHAVNTELIKELSDYYIQDYRDIKLG